MKQDLNLRLDKVAELFCDVCEKDDFKGLLQDLMTPQEIVELWERMQIIKNLKQKMTQRKVAEKMWVSVTTVNRGARVLKFGTWMADKYIKAED